MMDRVGTAARGIRLPDEKEKLCEASHNFSFSSGKPTRVPGGQAHTRGERYGRPEGGRLQMTQSLDRAIHDFSRIAQFLGLCSSNGPDKIRRQSRRKS